MEDKWSDINIIGIGIGGWNGRGRAAGQKDLLERAGGLLTARQICIPTHTHTHTQRDIQVVQLASHALSQASLSL